MVFDVAVIGGGPAGMMAAGRAAEMGASVVLLEKNARTGEKLLITGGGRCNITNAQQNIHKLVERYGERGKPLFSVFTRFSPEDTFRFFESRGLALKVEAELRAFPVSDKAADVHQALLDYLKETNVHIQHSSPVRGFLLENNRITGVTTATGDIRAKAFILATGGKSHPETGSTGEGFSWLKAIGIKVIEPDPALVPVVVQESWIAHLMGISMKNVQLSIIQNGKSMHSHIGKILFTHFGLSGPGVLNMSRKIGEAMKTGVVSLTIDFFPTLDSGTLDRRMMEVFEAHKNKRLKNAIGELFPPRLCQPLFNQAGIDGETPLYRLPREDRLRLGAALKAFVLTPARLLGPEDAVITSGGVAQQEVDFTTMRSKKYDNLFLIGDVLDFDRPSGGFSLQICWATGWIAGEGAALYK